MRKNINIILILLGFIMLAIGCISLKQKQTTVTTPDPADIINSPEFIAKHGLVVRDVPYPPAKVFTLKEKIDEADIVVEAKAVAYKEFNKTSADSVRTSYLLLVYKVFKGDVKTDTIELTVKGGYYTYLEPDEEYFPGYRNPLAGQTSLIYERGQTIPLNEYATFFLKRNPQPDQQSAFKQIPNQYKFTAQWHRNYLWYDGHELYTIGPNMCTEHNRQVLNKYYRILKKLTKRKYKELHPLCPKTNGAFLQNKQSDEQLVITITGFSKDSVPAGTQTNLSHLSIYGSGFGLNKGEVHFKNANTGGSDEVIISSRDILYWSNDSIQVHVPSMGDSTQLDRCAGSGVVKIVRADSPIDSITSTMGIVVPYSIKNNYSNIAKQYYRPKLMSFNAPNLSYIIRYDTTIYNNKPALAAFRRALERWRCTTGIDFKEFCQKGVVHCGNNTQNGVIRVSFDKPCLPSNPLALGETQITKMLTCATPTDTSV